MMDKIELKSGVLINAIVTSHQILVSRLGKNTFWQTNKRGIDSSLQLQTKKYIVLSPTRPFLWIRGCKASCT